MFFDHCILSKIESNDLKKMCAHSTVLIQDVTYLAHKENTHGEIIVLGRQKTFNCILFSYGSDKMVSHT